MKDVLIETVSNAECLGIIYQAYNTVTGKSYVGQTVTTLQYRKNAHYVTSKVYRHKFASALKKYPAEVWEWTVLIETDVTKLDEYEVYFIDQLNSFKDGYNSTIGGRFNVKNCSDFIYELYHPEHGYLSTTRSNLMKCSPAFSHVCNLQNGRSKQIEGWVLATNKDKYDEIMGVKEYYHPDHGVVKCTKRELHENYIGSDVSINSLSVLYLKSKICACRGWVLAKYKDEYSEMLTTSNSRRKYSSNIRNSSFVERTEDERRELALRLHAEGWSKIKIIKEVWGASHNVNSPKYLTARVEYEVIIEGNKNRLYLSLFEKMAELITNQQLQINELQKQSKIDETKETNLKCLFVDTDKLIKQLSYTLISERRSESAFTRKLE